MPSLRLLLSHHEGRVIIRVPLQGRGDVASLQQQDQWPAAQDTSSEKWRVLSTKINSLTRGPTAKNPYPSGADHGSAGKPTAPPEQLTAPPDGGGLEGQTREERAKRETHPSSPLYAAAL